MRYLMLAATTLALSVVFGSADVGNAATSKVTDTSGSGSCGAACAVYIDEGGNPNGFGCMQRSNLKTCLATGDDCFMISCSLMMIQDENGGRIRSVDACAVA